MGTWSAGITGNDTAQDLMKEYTVAFYKYPVDEALEKLDAYVRTNICDESDPEEWVNYYYSRRSNRRSRNRTEQYPRFLHGAFSLGSRL